MWKHIITKLKKLLYCGYKVESLDQEERKKVCDYVWSLSFAALTDAKRLGQNLLHYKPRSHNYINKERGFTVFAHFSFVLQCGVQVVGTGVQTQELGPGSPGSQGLGGGHCQSCPGLLLAARGWSKTELNLNNKNLNIYMWHLDCIRQKFEFVLCLHIIVILSNEIHKTKLSVPHHLNNIHEFLLFTYYSYN